MDHLRSLPVKVKGELPVIPVDERAAEASSFRLREQRAFSLIEKNFLT